MMKFRAPVYCGLTWHVT